MSAPAVWEKQSPPDMSFKCINSLSGPKMGSEGGWRGRKRWYLQSNHGGTVSTPNYYFLCKKNSFFYLTKVFLFFVKSVLNWANISFAEYILEYLSNRTLFLNWAHSLPNMVWTVWQTMLRSQLAYNEMQALAWTCSRSTADSVIQNVG